MSIKYQVGALLILCLLATPNLAFAKSSPLDAIMFSESLTHTYEGVEITTE
ncbi:MAG: hypothetical protein ACJAUP_000768 [Cellvibrionaceae bacterium]|jgi:hypothetical protein